jgi:hypothetical protein
MTYDPWSLPRRLDQARWRVALGVARLVLPSDASVALRHNGTLDVAVPISRWAWLGVGLVHLIVRADVRDRVRRVVRDRCGFAPKVEVQWKSQT